jgi:hypothetical protein
MSEKIPAALPTDALRQQIEADPGLHPTPDQERAAEKRRAAAGLGEDVKSSRAKAPVGRTSAAKQTVSAPAKHTAAATKAAPKKQTAANKKG